MFIFDAHLDLAMNAIDWNRDLRQTIEEINESEAGMNDKPGRTRATVSLPAMREGNIGLCMATQIARYVKKGNPLPGWHSPEQAWAHTQAQLAWYRAMENAGEMVQITDLKSLERHLDTWNNDNHGKKAIGYILSLEGADSMVTPQWLEKSYQDGLRAVGPAHYGPGTYAHGTDSTGGLSSAGRELLKEMERLGIILDVTHLSDESFWESIDLFKGAVWASHNNCRALVDHQRQFSDDQIRALIGRDAVIGVVLDAWMMIPAWKKGTSTPENTDLVLEHIVNHIDHICQLAGNADHVGIGSDLDGGFGKEQCPSDLNTIADLQSLPSLLAKRGYSPQEIKQIMHGNFLDFLRNHWS